VTTESRVSWDVVWWNFIIVQKEGGVSVFRIGEEGIASKRIGEQLTVLHDEGLYDVCFSFTVI
jgi:hypothetical protein